MTVFDYLCGEAFIILLVFVPCVMMYILALLIMKVADHYSDSEARIEKPRRAWIRNECP